MRKQNYTGKKYGRLTAKVFKGCDSSNRQYWEFVCDCGKVKDIRLDHVKSGRTSSCGCLAVDTCRELFTTHGETHSDLHTTWTNIRQRCNNPANPDYVRYGGRGIQVCESWDDFEKFKRDMGPKPSPDYTIERIDNNGNYCKDNCKWATRKEQANNRGGY